MQLTRLVALAHAAIIPLGASTSFQKGLLSPVTRVVELLKDLAKKVEDDQKKETDLFESYQCWAKTVVDTKTAENTKANSRIDDLRQYVSDLESGKIELTTERVDLEKELESLTKDIASAEMTRGSEHGDFVAAKREMTQAIAALTDAISVLEAMSSGSSASASSFLATDGSQEEVSTLRALMSDRDELSYALDFGRRFLSKGDAVFLTKVLSADVPAVDSEMLNKKADFKASYEARSGEITETLSGLLTQFESNLVSMENKEQKAKDDHDRLMSSKNAMKSAAEEALEQGELEGAARGQTKGEANAEIVALEAQVLADQGFITQTESDLTAKTTLFDQRKSARAEEGQALSQAIAILYSDDARDNFKKSFSSQGYSFLQRGAHDVKAALATKASKAVDVLRRAGSRTGDKRLVALVSLASSVTRDGEKEAIDTVVTAIDNMIVVLKAEEETDTRNKEDCESARVEDTHSAIEVSREIDDMSDEVARIKEEIDELNVQIGEHQASIKSLQDELTEATRIRDDEKAAWTVSDKQDADAASTVQSATDVLKTFYAQGKFLQLRGNKRQPLSEQVKAGEAPPPPPSTFADEPVSNQAQSKGIIEILMILKADIEKDQVKAKAAEDAAQAAYDTFKTDNEAEVATLGEDISTLEGEVGDKETAMGDKETERDTSKGELVTTLSKIKELEPGCDFITINYGTRVVNRNHEMDGLEEAKAILQGAVFPE